MLIDFILKIIPILLYILIALKMASKRLNDENFWKYVEDCGIPVEINKTEITVGMIIVFLFCWIPISIYQFFNKRGR